MTDDLAGLPLKSMQLPTKTVAKLKPLGLTTIADLYAVPLARLIELGLVQRELDEIAEAASDFGCAWSSKADVKAALAASGAAPPTPAKAKTKASVKAPKDAKPAKQRVTPAPGPLPADFAEALARGPEALGLTVADVDALASYGNHTDGFRTPPPSARHLRVFRRLRLLRAESVGGAERWYVVAVVDLTQVPRERRGDLQTVLGHLGNLIVDVFNRAGVENLSQRSGGAIEFAIHTKSRAKAEKLVVAHRARFDSAPCFALPIDNLAVIGATALLSAGLQEEALPLAPRLASAARDLASATAIHALSAIARMYLAEDRPRDGLALAAPILTPEALANTPRTHDATAALFDAARLCARAEAPALAVLALARAVAVDPSEVHSDPIRGRILAEPAFDGLHAEAAFRAIFRGFPAFEARLAAKR